MSPYRAPPTSVFRPPPRRGIHWWAVGFVSGIASLVLLMWLSIAMIVLEPFFR